jgi:hypothetical protein
VKTVTRPALLRRKTVNFRLSFTEMSAAGEGGFGARLKAGMLAAGIEKPEQLAAMVALVILEQLSEESTRRWLSIGRRMITSGE